VNKKGNIYRRLLARVGWYHTEWDEFGRPWPRRKLVFDKVYFRCFWKSRWEFKIRWPIYTCVYFLKLAYLGFRSKIWIMESRPTESKGGYKYYDVVISKTPLSKNHKYNDLGG